MPVEKRGDKYLGVINFKGQKKTRSFDTYREAEEWAVTGKAAWKRGEPVDMGDGEVVGLGGAMPLSLLRDEVIRYRWAGTKSARTHEQNSKSVVELLGGDTPVRSLTTRRIEDIQIKMAEQGNSDSTINRKMSSLSVMLNYAVDQGYIDKAPKIPRKKEPEHRIRYVSDVEEMELVAFFQHIGDEDMADLIQVGLDTGGRMSELLRLEVRDTEQRKVFFWVTKSSRPRAVPLTSRAAAIIEKRKEGKASTEKLFPGMTKDSVIYSWNKARLHMKLAGDPQFTFHVLRHTFCSRLAQRGVPIPAIKELAGHSTIVTTQRYVHMAPENLRDAIAMLESPTGLQSAGSTTNHHQWRNSGDMSINPMDQPRTH